MERIALVTGSTNNVGKGIAEALSKGGFTVIVTSRHENDGKEVARHLAREGDYRQVDFADANQISDLFSWIEKKYGRLDVLVNNVAYTSNESILECTLETWEKTLNTNLRSYFLCTKYASELMKDHGGGSIVNVTIYSTRGLKDKFSYVVSKGGINSLTGCAAADLAPYNIRVNAVAIGPTGTPVGSREFADRTRGDENAACLAGHVGQPADVAQAVSFLASEKAGYIWGTILNVDGGAGLR